MGNEKKVEDVNELLRIEVNGLNLAQLVFCQAVLFPEIAYVIDMHADALIELGD